MKLTKIAAIANAKISGLEKDIDIKSISTDSRTVKKGELFIAIKGQSFNGGNFISDAVKKGALAVMVDDHSSESQSIDVPLLAVESAKHALILIAKAHRDKFRIPFICIVGSNGKTTTKDLLSHMLQAEFKVLKTEENHNNQIGVAKTLLRLKDQDIAVIEAGTNSPGEIAYHSRIISPDIVITTNIGMSHLQGLKNRTGVFREKIAMVESLPKAGVWIKNLDDKMLSPVSYEGIKEIGFAIKNKDAEYRAEHISYKSDSTAFMLRGKKFYSPLLGTHNVYNALGAIAAAGLFMDQRLIQKSLSCFSPTPGRMEVFKCNGFKIINDTYNSNPASLKSAVSALKNIKGKGRKFFVCADMLELGKRSAAIHHSCGRFIAKSGTIDKLVLFGRHAGYTCKGALKGGMKKKDIIEFKDKSGIADFLKEQASEKDVVLVKGSRSMKMEEVVHGLLDSHKT